MELRPLAVMILLMSFIQTGQAQADNKPVLSPQIFSGETVTLKCNIVGGSGPYHWYKDDVNVHRSDENSYTIKVDQSHKYKCYGSRDGQKTTVSDEVTFSVIERPKAVLTLQTDGQIFSGQVVTLACKILGQADNDWTYYWYEDGVQRSCYENREYSIRADSSKYTCIGRRKSNSQTSEISNTFTLTVLEKPKPTVSGNPQRFIYTGDTVTLTCNLQSTGWTFLWYKDRQHLHKVAKDTNTLHDTVTYAGETVYQCIANRGNDYYYSESSPVTITVRARPKPAVSIQPDNQVYRGETVTLRCDIQDEEDSHWTYSWNKDGTGVSSEQEYTISSVTTTHAGKYTCRGTERGGSHSHTSDDVTLAVSEKPKPELISDFKGDVLTGNSVILYCTLKLQSTGWKFYWSKDTQSRETETETDYYFIRSVSVSDGGQYWCRAGRGNPVYYTHYSDAVWVNDIESPKAVVIIKPDKHVFRGETVTLRCQIQGGGRDTEWTYDWYKNDYTQNPYRTTQEFRLSPVTNDDSGKYSCVGRRNSDSQFLKISDAVTLTVSGTAETVVSVSPLNWLTEGDSVTLSCEVKHSSTGWTFSWYTDVLYRDSQGFLMNRTALLSDSSRGSGGSYTLSHVTLIHTGVYMCRAERGEPVFHTQYSRPQPLWITGESPPVSLIISPSRTQHFTADSLSLSCEDQSVSTGWTVRRYTHTETLFKCSSVSGSTCNLSSLSTSHTGVYWCQSESGGRSNPVNITVHNGDVILESPVHPVTEGNPLTLRCLHRNTRTSDSGVDFYKDDSVIQKQTTGEMIIHTVSKSDEGFYHCKHPERGESPKSWVSVRGLSQAPMSVLRLISSLVTVSVYLLLTIILAVKCYRARVQTDEVDTQNTVTEE